MYAYVKISLYFYIIPKKVGFWYCSQYIYWEQSTVGEKGGILQTQPHFVG